MLKKKFSWSGYLRQCMNMNHDKIAQTKPMSQSTKKVHINNKLDCLKNNVLLHFKNIFEFVIFKILLYLIKKEKKKKRKKKRAYGVYTTRVAFFMVAVHVLAMTHVCHSNNGSMYAYKIPFWCLDH